MGDTADLRVTLELNGQLMQDESTKDMIFDVATLISAASQTSPLLPGDLLLTGSPAGNGSHWGVLLRDGDVMDRSITGLGNQGPLPGGSATMTTTTSDIALDRDDPEGAIAAAARRYSQLGPLGRGRRARHAQLPR